MARPTYPGLNMYCDPGVYKAATVNVVDESPEHHDELVTDQPGQLSTQDTNYPARELESDPQGYDRTAPQRRIEGQNLTTFAELAVGDKFLLLGGTDGVATKVAKDTYEDRQGNTVVGDLADTKVMAVTRDVEAERGFNLSDLTERQTNVPNRANPYRDWGESYNSWNQYEDPMDKMGTPLAKPVQGIVDYQCPHCNVVLHEKFGSRWDRDSGALVCNECGGAFHYKTEEERARDRAATESFFGGRTAQKEDRPPTVAVDMDETLLGAPDYDTPTPAGQPGMAPANEGAAGAMNTFRELGWRVLVYTARFSKAPTPAHVEQYRDEIVDHLQRENIHFDEVWTGPKPIADAYIDDKAVRFEGDWYATIREITMQSTERSGPADPEYDKDGVALIDTVDNPNDWTNVDEQRRDRSIPRPPDTERIKYPAR